MNDEYEKYREENFKEHKLSVRNSDGFFNATMLLIERNKAHITKKSLSEFWSNKTTKCLMSVIKNEHRIERVFTSSRGITGGTFMHKDLLNCYYNWLYKLPSPSFVRDETHFVNEIINTFQDVLTFSTQASFDLYKVDLLCESLNLIIEYDELHHKKQPQTRKDIKRQNDISGKYGYKFIRHSEDKPISETINKIIKLCLNT